MSHHDIAPLHERCQSKHKHHKCYKNVNTEHIHKCICDITWEEVKK